MKKNGFKLTKKGIIALAVLIILLAGAIWLNIRLNGENPADGGSADGTSAPGKDGAIGNKCFHRRRQCEYLQQLFREFSR